VYSRKFWIVVCENEGLLRDQEKKKSVKEIMTAVEAHWSDSLKVKVMHSSPKGFGGDDLITSWKILKQIHVLHHYLPQ